MVGSATFTIEPSTTSRKVTAHSSASVTLPRGVARNDGGGASDAVMASFTTRRLPSRGRPPPRRRPASPGSPWPAPARSPCPRRPPPSRRSSGSRCRRPRRARRNRSPRCRRPPGPSPARRTRPATRQTSRRRWARSRTVHGRRRRTWPLSWSCSVRWWPLTGAASNEVDDRTSVNWVPRHRPIRGAGGVGTFKRAGRARRKEEVRGCMETSDLIARARAGDDNAFRELVEVHSHELQVHCYRILGSLQDAEDALQETLMSAWRNLGDFRQQSSLRTWLYQIATNRCLSMLRADSRRPRIATPIPDLTLPEPTSVSDVPPWLEPYPDVLLDNLVDQAPGPETRYETTEAISLAFITALQLLPPRQRAVLVLRDVLGYRAGEVARMLEPAYFLHPTYVQLQVRPPCGQRVQAAVGAPGAIAAQVRFGVLAGGAL